jgi:hypothetical protein
VHRYRNDGPRCSRGPASKEMLTAHQKRTASNRRHYQISSPDYCGPKTIHCHPLLATSVHRYPSSRGMSFHFSFKLGSKPPFAPRSSNKPPADQIAARRHPAKYWHHILNRVRGHGQYSVAAIRHRAVQRPRLAGAIIRLVARLSLSLVALAARQVRYNGFRR